MRSWRVWGWVARAVRWGWRRIGAPAGDPIDGAAALSGQTCLGRIGGAWFLLLSPEPPPRGEEANRLILEARSRLRAGTAFVELGRAAARGAVFACRIREEGPMTAEHIAVISPTPEPWA